MDRAHFAFALLAATLWGCGGGETTSGSAGSGGHGGNTYSWTGGGTGGTSSSSSSSTGAVGGALTCDNGEGTVLAVSELLFGEGSSGQWKKVGTNLDGLDSTASSTDVCQPNSGANTSTPYPDGDNGIDNSFGKNLLPVILALYPNWVDGVNGGINDGVFTSLLRLECLPPSGDVPVMVTKLFGGVDLGGIPAWDGTDQWPVAPELLSNISDPLSSTVTFQQSSVYGTSYDSGKNNTFILTVPLETMNGSTSIKLTLYAAHVTMTLSVDRKDATDGVISGVLATEELVAEVKKIGALMNLCGTDAFDGILTTVRQASDIMVDGTQDPNEVCNGISLGLGFKMHEAQIAAAGLPATVGMSCP